MSKITVCNKCKNQTEMSSSYYQRTPGGWNNITVSGTGIQQTQFDLCPICSDKFGIEKNKPINDGEKILDILSDMVEDAVSNC